MIDQLFSTPVYKSKVKNFNLIQKEVKCAIEIEKNNFDNIIFNGNIIKECKIKVLKKEIYSHIKKYKKHTPFNYTSSNNSLGKNPKIIASWITRIKKNNYFATHDHGMYDISGCYYYKTSDSNGDLFFEAPGIWGGKHTISPEEGQIILFPSWLKHGVTFNTMNETRMSLAFNVVFKR